MKGKGITTPAPQATPAGESPLWAVLFAWFVLPGLVFGGAGVLTMMRAGWAVLAAPAWMLGVYIACVWIAGAGMLVLRRAFPLPRRLRLRDFEQPVPWTRVAPLLASPAIAMMLGMADASSSPQLAGLMPVAAGLIFVGGPLAVVAIVVLEVVERVDVVRRPADAAR